MATMLIVDDEIDMRMLVRLVIEMANSGLTKHDLEDLPSVIRGLTAV